MKAKAIVANKPGSIEVTNIHVPEPGDEDVVIDLTQSWISNGTERSFIRGERIAGDTPYTNDQPMPFPMVLGYQKVGIIKWVGKHVQGLSVGETVFSTVSKVSNMFYSNGGHVSPAVTHSSQVWKIPDGVASEAVSGLVLTQVGYNCGICCAVKPGDQAVVIGDGLVGHWAAQTLRWRGAIVHMVGRHPKRLACYDSSSVHQIIHVRDGLTPEDLQRKGISSVQILVDTVGSVESIMNAMPLLTRFARIVSAGFHGKKGQLDIQRLRDKELTVHAPSGWTTPRMDETMRLVAKGVLDTQSLITHRFNVDRASCAYRLILDKTDHFLGVCLDWEG